MFRSWVRTAVNGRRVVYYNSAIFLKIVYISYQVKISVIWISTRHNMFTIKPLLCLPENTTFLFPNHFNESNTHARTQNICFSSLHILHTKLSLELFILSVRVIEEGCQVIGRWLILRIQQKARDLLFYPTILFFSYPNIKISTFSVTQNL